MARPRTIDDKVVIERYLADEEVAAIAASYGVDQKTVYNVLKRNNIAKKQARLTESQKLDIAARYAKDESAVDIAAALGVSKRTVYNIVGKSGGPRQTMGSLSAEQEDLIVARYAAGEPVLQISRDFTNVHLQTIHNMLKRRGVVDPARAKPRVGAARESQILDAVRGGSNVPAAMTAFGVSESTVSRLLRETRAAGENIKLPQGHPRTCAVDDAAFDALTPDSLYWRGFLHADGCVHYGKDGSPVLVCGLGEKDIGHLIKLRDFLKSTHAISVREPGRQSFGGPIAYYSVRSKQICASLTAYGLVTHRTQSPAIELAESPDFWRGAVDGDGWIGVSENKGNFYAYIGFCGQLPVVEAYQQFLSERGLAELSITPTESGIWKVQTMGAKAEAIVRLIYRDASTVLDRKGARAAAISRGDLRRFAAYEEGPVSKKLETAVLDELLSEVD
jgi:transposase/uncharacterized protein (DUF433 family)